MAKKKAKSAAIVAKEAELTREAELLRLQQVQERIRNEELQVRQRIEEEEHKLLEHLRIREQTIANSIAERARQSTFDAMEKELLETVERKERDIQELRAKVHGQQVAQEDLARERESALRRTAMLNNELELVQTKLLESEAKLTAQERANQEAQEHFSKQYDELQLALSTTRGAHVFLQKQHQELMEEVERQVEATAAITLAEQLTPEKILEMDPSELPKSTGVDTEMAVLFKVLHGEVGKYKEKAVQLQAELDAKVRDDEKSSLLVGILNTQLDSVREDNKRLHTSMQSRQKEVEVIQLSLQEEKKKSKELYQTMDRATSESAVHHRQLQLEIGVHKAQVEELTKRLGEVQHEHLLLEAEHKDLVLRSTSREQEDFKTNVAMKAELLKQKEDLANVLKEKQAMQDEAFQYKVLNRAEMDSLKVRLRKFEEEMERKERESYETTTVLRADVEKLKNEKKLLLDSTTAEKNRLTSDLERYVKSLNEVERELTELRRHSTQVQKDLYEKLTHMTACHDSKHEEVIRLREELEKKETEYTNNAIFLNAKNENYRSTLEAMEKDAEERRIAHLNHVESLTQELTALQNHVMTELQQSDEAKKVQEDRAERAERNAHRLQEEVRRLMGETKQLKDTKAAEILHHNRELREFQGELSMAKRTIERLEGTLGDQVSYKQMTELNEKLSDENTTYKTQIQNLNSTIASMKLESDYMKELRVSRMGEVMEQLRQRNNQLEYLHKLTIPLLTELRAIVQQHGMTRAMQSALERYDLNVNRAELVTNDDGELLQVGVGQSPPLPSSTQTKGTNTTLTNTANSAIRIAPYGGSSGRSVHHDATKGKNEQEKSARSNCDSNGTQEAEEGAGHTYEAASISLEEVAVEPVRAANHKVTYTASFKTLFPGTPQSIAAVLPKMCYPHRLPGSAKSNSAACQKSGEDDGKNGGVKERTTIPMETVTSSGSGRLGAPVMGKLPYGTKRNLPPL